MRRAERAEGQLDSARSAREQAEREARAASDKANMRMEGAERVAERARSTTRALARTTATAERRRDLAEKKAEGAGVRVRFGRYGRLDDDDDDEDVDEDEDGEYSQMDAVDTKDEDREEEERAGSPGNKSRGRSGSPLDLRASGRSVVGKGGRASSRSGTDGDEYSMEVGALHEEISRARQRGSYPGAPSDEPMGSPSMPRVSRGGGGGGSRGSRSAALGRTSDPQGLLGRTGGGSNGQKQNAGGAEAKSAKQLREEVMKYRQARRGR